MNKFYLTTSIAYTNAPPHIGFALESIQADVVARYRRQYGDNVFFLTGTDEHGAKISRAAKEGGKDIKVFVDEIAEKDKALKELLNLSWDDFIRTTDQKRHWPEVAQLWKKLVESGDIYKKKYRGFYCVGHEAFVTEKDLVDGKCKDHQTKPEVIEEENYFFQLSKYAKEIEARIRNNELRIIPETRKNEMLAFIKEGLEDVSFSRPRKDLSWGIPVPDDDSQTIYVWCDALTNYISGYSGIEKWKEHPADVHMIGKDILRFHALIWPGMLLSAKLPLPKTIFVHGHITSGGQKISKTLGNIIDPFELVKRYGIDPVRYYLLREIPAYDDGDFSYEKFEERYNGDLANGLGNFASRVLTLGEKLGEIKFDLDGNLEKLVIKKIDEIKKEIEKSMKEYKFHEALVGIWDLISFGDQYVNDKKPWQKSEEGKENKEKTILNLIVILDNVAAMLLSFLPDTSKKITDNIHWISKNKLQIKKGEVLFPRK
jgi:methionyl-tRNA synthetase